MGVVISYYIQGTPPLRDPHLAMEHSREKRIAVPWKEGAEVLEEWRGSSRGWVKVRALTAMSAYVFPDRTDMRSAWASSRAMPPLRFCAELANDQNFSE